jgi:YidC/Oxa1 family membrane protein insertase
MNLWNVLLTQPLTTALVFFYAVFGGNLGLAIIALTVALRVLLLPLSLPALKSARAQKKIRPKLEKIKKKYKDDRQKLAQAQMELFQKAGINPFAGCLPQILQLVILIALYRVFMDTLGDGGFNTQFLIWDLSQADRYFILPVAAAATQFIFAKLSFSLVSEEEVAAEATEEAADDVATAMQKQNLYLFPVLTLFIGSKLPSGLMLYWFFQQWWVMKNGKLL